MFPMREHYVLHTRRVPLPHCVLKPAVDLDDQAGNADEGSLDEGAPAAPMAGEEGGIAPDLLGTEPPRAMPDDDAQATGAVRPTRLRQS